MWRVEPRTLPRRAVDPLPIGAELGTRLLERGARGFAVLSVLLDGSVMHLDANQLTARELGMWFGELALIFVERS